MARVVLETERLVLRELTHDDAPFIVELLNEPSFIANIGDKGVRTLDDARDYISAGPMASYEAHGFGLWLTRLKDEYTPIGICGLLKRETLDHADIGIAFMPAYTGGGYALEACTAVLRHGREVLGIETIVAVTSMENPRSHRLLDRLGYVFERTIEFGDDGEECRLFVPEGSRSSHVQ